MNDHSAAIKKVGIEELILFQKKTTPAGTGNTDGE